MSAAAPECVFCMRDERQGEIEGGEGKDRGRTERGEGGREGRGRGGGDPPMIQGDQ